LKEISSAIPTNIITGFLGVGKTTAIQHLLSLKPEKEIWSVLVNEFGEVGLDASLIETTLDKQQKIAIREVPGGCMCCTSGLPMQVALNQLIKHSKPTRLFIEPTGLGHPKEILKSLSHASYQGVLAIQNTLTLIDARKISDTRYTEHEIFRQQLHIADIIIANKSDQYDHSAINNLERFLQTMKLEHLPLYEVTKGQVQLDWLNKNLTKLDSKFTKGHSSIESLQMELPDTLNSVLAQGHIELPTEGYIRKDNKGSGYHSSGWVFAAHFCFNKNQLISLFSGLDVTRLKAIFITEEGIMSFNQVDTVLSYSYVAAVDEATDSRIEIIGQNTNAWEKLEAKLLKASKQKSK